MSDPLHENCRGFAESGGLVTGVKLTHVPMAQTKYELIEATLIDERAAQGNIVARVFVKDKKGVDAMVNCWMAWPWKGHMPASWEGKGLPGNPNYPYQHMITNVYNPLNSQGPLAIYIGDANGAVNSDVIAGLGLPAGRHVGYHLVFQERGGQTPTQPTQPSQPNQPTTPAGDDILARLQRIEQKLDRIAERFGIQG